MNLDLTEANDAAKGRMPKVSAVDVTVRYAHDVGPVDRSIALKLIKSGPAADANERARFSCRIESAHRAWYEDVHVAGLLDAARIHVLGPGAWTGLRQEAVSGWVNGEPVGYVNSSGDFQDNFWDGARGLIVTSPEDPAMPVRWGWSHPSYDKIRRPFIIEWSTP